MNTEISIEQLEQLYSEMNQILSENLGKLKMLEKKESELRFQQETSEKEVDILEKCVSVIGVLAEKSKERIIPFMEKLITSGLQCVFGPEYKFKATMEIKGSKPVIDFYVVQDIDGKELTLNLSSNLVAGGTKDVVSVILRIIFKVLFRNVIKGPLILDESFSALDKERSKNLFPFLSSCAKDFDLQIILVTHDVNANNPDVQENFDTLYRVEKIKGRSKVVCLKENGENE